LHQAKLATLADLDSIFGLMQRMQLDDPWTESFDESRVRFNLAELLKNPVCGLIYLAQDNHRTIAYLIICFDYSLEYRGKGAWVDELFVEPDHRRMGIGAYLLDLAESASREHGAQFLHLEVGHGNRAIELYRRRGFVDHKSNLMTKQLQPRESPQTN
jgi:GNAT superfamily N-acetyltransferase